MKIFVCIKQVPDTESRIQIKSDKSGIEETGVKWVMNPYDEYAVEESLKLREANVGSTVTVVTLGPKARAIDALRTALAMGVDDGLVVDHAGPAEPYLVATALAAALKKEGAFDLVLAGKLAIDDNAACVPQMMAELLGVPHVSVVGKLTYAQPLVAEREAEGGAREVFAVTGPCVISANKGLNTPRYATLPNIMKAKKKPVKETTLAELAVPAAGKTRYKDFELPPAKPAVKMIDGDPAAQARELVRLVVEEAKVL